MKKIVLAPCIRQTEPQEPEGLRLCAVMMLQTAGVRLGADAFQDVAAEELLNAVNTALDKAGAADALEAADETGTPLAKLCQHITAGLPVVVGLTKDCDPEQAAHGMLLVGYSDADYWFNDPWEGRSLCKYPKEQAEACYAAQGSFALALRRR